MKSKILVSACLITYNQEEYIEECIKGALSQEVDRYEIIIGDDCSTDRTSEICYKYAELYPNLIKYHRKDRNLGMIGNWMDTIKKAQGKYIAICEGDDYWTDSLKLQKQVDFLDENEEYMLCFTNCSTVDSYGQIKNPKFINYDKDRSFSAEDLMFIAPTLTRVFRNQFLNINYGNVIALDAVMLIEQMKLGKAWYLNINTSNYRKHDKGIWSLKPNLEKKINYFDVRFYGFKNTNGNVKKNFLKQCLKAISKIRLLDKLKSEEKYDEFNNYYIKNKYPKSVKIIVYLFSLLNTNHLLSDKIIYKLQIRLIEKI